MRILPALQTLGETPNDVAAAMRLYGVTGHRHDTRDGPLPRYLSRVVGCRDFEVNHNMVKHDQHRVTWMPLPVAQFVQAFDAGEYPDLIADNE